MEFLNLPASILERAQDITLAELLDCPLAQCFMVSALFNAQGTIDFFAPEDLSDTDRLLHYRLRDVAINIPSEDRIKLFRQCSRIIHQRREERVERDERERSHRKQFSKTSSDQ